MAISAKCESTIVDALAYFNAGNFSSLTFDDLSFTNKKEQQLVNELIQLKNTFININKQHQQFAEGIFEPLSDFIAVDSELSNSVRQVSDSYKDVLAQAKTIAKGDYSAEISPRGNADELGITLFDMTKTLREITTVCESVSEGNLALEAQVKGRDDLLGNAVNRMISNLYNAAQQADQIANGDYSAEIQPRSDQDILGKALFAMTKSLRELSIRTEAEEWFKEGQSQLSNMMRGEQDIETLCSKVLRHLANYIGAGAGVFYVSDDKNQLHLKAHHACDNVSKLRNTFNIGEGLIGQSAPERTIIENQDISNNPVLSPHGLGNIALNYLLILPIALDEEIKGVLQLASAEALTQHQLDFLQAVTESIAIAINSAQARFIMKDLLEESQRQSEELQEQSEELRAANEEMEEQTAALKQSEEELKTQQAELQATNEELEEKTEYLEKQKADIQQKNDAINQAQTALEIRAQELETASKYKSEFLANMSHELRTPLNSLLILAKSFADNDDGNLTEVQVESANIIHSGGEDLLNLINDILDLSKVEAGKLDIDMKSYGVDVLSKSIHRQFHPVAQQKQLQFTIEHAENLPDSLISDERRISQILKNLLSNAFKFTSQGSVTLNIHLPDTQTIFLNPNLSVNHSIAFTVQDTGIGIPEDKQRDIFEAFQQADGSTSRNYGGTGLGLTISRELAKLLGGEIQLKSEMGQGSTFTLLLPLTPIQSEARQDRQGSEIAPPETLTNSVISEDAKATNGKFALDPSIAVVEDDRAKTTQEETSILVIEDDFKFSTVLKNIIHKKGHHFISAGTGRGGLQLAETYSPNAILLDMGLPDMDGMHVLEQLKFNLRTRHIPVHIISGREETSVARQKGAIGYLQKPVKTEALNTALNQFETLWQERPKNVLVVEDEVHNREAIIKLLDNRNTNIAEADTGESAYTYLENNQVDCLILDLGLPDFDGLELLNRVSKNLSFTPPVIIYTGRSLTDDEMQQLNSYSASIVIKSVNSPERLLDEVSLFLHAVESHLPDNQRNMIKMLHDPGKLLKGRKILVVDDDLRNIFALTGVLQKQGMKVIKAENGQVALEKLDNEVGIELVIMDIMMPVMDGYEAMKRIRAQQRFADLPVIALTAKAMPEDRQECIEAGASDYLTKPLDPDNLLSLMRVLLFDAA